jgi:hypothetical protein
MLKTVLRYANLLAIIGTAWMAIIVLTMRLYPTFVQSLMRYTSVVAIFAVTELVFTFSLLFFFVCFYLYAVQQTRQMAPAHGSVAAITGAGWMSVVAILHRFPTAWRWVAIQASGLILRILQVVFVVPLVFFFVFFYRRYKEGKYTLRLQIATIVGIIGTSWLLLVSATHVSPMIWRWLFQKGVVKFMIITEPVVAFSLLLFLIMFYLEPEA